ncbi:acylphosphatase [Luteimonas saliphila]|uniref:acylphosphatase n=1 Tax=Luteimonas saliphila TaxID=2804919 RepID=UPI003CCCC32C
MSIRQARSAHRLIQAFAAARFLVSGRVPGVCFRVRTRTQALGLGLRGYAKNLPDGSVEVVAVGEAQALEALAQWLEDGRRWRGWRTSRERISIP